MSMETTLSTIAQLSDLLNQKESVVRATLPALVKSLQHFLDHNERPIRLAAAKVLSQVATRFPQDIKKHDLRKTVEIVGTTKDDELGDLLRNVVDPGVSSTFVAHRPRKVNCAVLEIIVKRITLDTPSMIQRLMPHVVKTSGILSATMQGSNPAEGKYSIMVFTFENPNAEEFENKLLDACRKVGLENCAKIIVPTDETESCVGSVDYLDDDPYLAERMAGGRTPSTAPSRVSGWSFFNSQFGMKNLLQQRLVEHTGPRTESDRLKNLRAKQNETQAAPAPRRGWQIFGS